MNVFPVNDSRAVFGKNESLYQCVLDDFKNAKFIGILTYNISPKLDSLLLETLKNACLNGTNAIIVTNIPKRFPSYFKEQYALAAKDMIDLYVRQLNPQGYGMRLNPYFAFHNHAKIVMTENIVYWGSSNYSDERSRNFECGTVSTDRELIAYLKDVLFPEIQSGSVPFYKYNFAVALANLESLIPACQAARQKLFDAAFEPWSEYETNFQDVWIYRTNDSGVTIGFLRGFLDYFSRFEDALDVIDSIIDEYCEYDELPDQVEELRTLYEEYKALYEGFLDTISTLFEELEQMARYDVSDEACRKINADYGMEAYDENLDYYAEKAMNEASGEYESLIEDAEPTVREALDSLDSMIESFQRLYDSLHQLLEVNSKIDNTGMN